MKKIIKLLISLAIIAGIPTAIYFYWPQIKEKLPQIAFNDDTKLLHIIDGDSLLIMKDKEVMEVRLIGYDAPELPIGDYDAECLAYEAIDEIQHIFEEDRALFIEEDKEVGDTDQYGRHLRYVKLKDGNDLAKLMLDKGLGKEMTVQPYSRREDYRHLQAEAEFDERGIWSEENCLGE